jgi:hypothetical protein
MRARFEQFFKQRMGLAMTILLLIVLMFVFVIPKIYFSLDEGSKKMYWSTFLLSFGIIMFVFFGRKSKKETLPQAKVVEASSAPRSYQKLLDEVERCSEALKKHRMRAYGCLMVGWIVLSIGRWSDHPPYNHPIFAIPVFVLALLGATRSIEEENELDVSIANCTAEGIEMERRRPGLKSSHFHDLAASYEGSGMWAFAFIRVSPPMMIIFSLLNAGPLSLFVNHFSFPWWTASCFSGLILGASFLFLARMACRPYQWLLEKKKAITA